MKPKKSESFVLPVTPYVPTVDQDLECCLRGLRDCLTKMRQTEVTDRAIRAVDRALKMMDIDLTRPAQRQEPLCAVCKQGTVDAARQCRKCGSIRPL